MNPVEKRICQIAYIPDYSLYPQMVCGFGSILEIDPRQIGIGLAPRQPVKLMPELMAMLSTKNQKCITQIRYDHQAMKPEVTLIISSSAWAFVSLFGKTRYPFCKVNI
jgi:hypothetical protein